MSLQALVVGRKDINSLISARKCVKSGDKYEIQGF